MPKPKMFDISNFASNFFNFKFPIINSKKRNKKRTKKGIEGAVKSTNGAIDAAADYLTNRKENEESERSIKQVDTIRFLLKLFDIDGNNDEYNGKVLDEFYKKYGEKIKEFNSGDRFYLPKGLNSNEAKKFYAELEKKEFVNTSKISSELYDEAMQSYKKTNNLNSEEPVILSKDKGFLDYLEVYINKKASEKLEEEQKKAAKEVEKVNDTSRSLSKFGQDAMKQFGADEDLLKEVGGDDNLENYISESFGENSNLDAAFVNGEGSDNDNESDNGVSDSNSGNDNSKNKKKSKLQRVKGALRTVEKGAVTAAKAVGKGAITAGKAVGKGAMAAGGAVATGASGLKNTISEKFGSKEAAFDKAKNVAEKAGSAVVRKGKAAGRGAKVFGNAVRDKASGLKRTIGKKLNHKEEIPPYTVRPKGKDSLPNADARFEAMKSRYDKFVEDHNNLVRDEHGAEIIKKAFENHPKDRQFYNEDAWFKEAVPLNSDNKEDVIAKYQELKNECLKYYSETLKKSYENEMGEYMNLAGILQINEVFEQVFETLDRLQRRFYDVARYSSEYSGKQKKERKVSGQDIKNQLVKVANRYNEFLRSYKKFAKKNKHSLEEIVKSVFPDKNGQYHWGKRVVDQHEEFKIDKSELDDKEKIAEKWKELSNRLVSYIPVSNTLKYAQIFNDINAKVGTVEDFETLMNEYNLPAKKILRYMQGVLARLNSTAAEGVVGRTLKAVTKGDKKTQEQERNLEDDLRIGKDENNKLVEPASEVDTRKIFTAFKNVADKLKNSENDGIDVRGITTLVSEFNQLKGFKGAIGSALNDSHNVAWGPTNFERDKNKPTESDNKKKRLYAMGVILISMAYLPGGSESILEACNGLKAGGIKGTSSEFIENASKVRKEIKKQALKGVTGGKLVNSLKSGNAIESLKYFINIKYIKQITNKFGKLGKLRRSKLGKVGSVVKKKAKSAGKFVKKKAGEAKESAQTKMTDLKTKYKDKSIKEMFGFKKKGSGEESQNKNS